MDTRRVVPALLALAALAAVPARSAAQTAAPPHVVHVQLAEYRVEVPDSVKQGESVLVVTNTGTVPHSLRVRGHRGLVSTRVIEPGQTVNVEMHLVAGEYVFFCGEMNGDREHRKEGMEHRVRVVW
jgi:hypothetical protein